MDADLVARTARPAVELLVLSDLNLRPTGFHFPTDALPVEEHDLVLSLGDVVDENREHAKSPSVGEAYEERGRETTSGHGYAHNPGERGVTVVHVALDGTLTSQSLDFN